MSARRLVLVVGVGRSGTSLLAGILGQVGFHVPQPEVQADATNPRGFGEPKWVVDFHRRLMRQRSVGVQVFDSRPQAFALTAAAGAVPADHGALRDWLGGQLDQADAIVVKDPRSGWFLPLWTSCARELEVELSTVTMLRHPAEILHSARTSYGTWQADASRLAGWVNQMLQIERATRGRPRAFIRYEDLLEDWERELRRAGAQLGVSQLTEVRRPAYPGVDAFVDLGLRRNRGHDGWEAAAIPRALGALADEVWAALTLLARAGQEDPAVHARLDAAHTAYQALYRDAEAIAESSIAAARPRRAPRPAAPPASRLRRVEGAVARRVPGLGRAVRAVARRVPRRP